MELDLWRDDESVHFRLDMRSISDRAGLKLIRKTCGWTQREMAHLMGVSTESLRKWETGKIDLPMIAQVLLMYLWRENCTKCSANLERNSELLGI